MFHAIACSLLPLEHAGEVKIDQARKPGLRLITSRGSIRREIFTQVSPTERLSEVLTAVLVL